MGSLDYVITKYGSVIIGYMILGAPLIIKLINGEKFVEVPLNISKSTGD